MRRVLLALVAALVGVGALAPAPASAHNELESSAPKEGASVAAAPAEIVLRYNQPVGRSFGKVAVTGPDGKAYADGEPVVESNVVTQRLKELGPEGEYVVGWRVVSADGHPISGSYSFWLGAKGESRAGQDEAETGGTPVVPIIVVTILVLGAAAGIVIAVQRTKRSKQP